MRECTCCSWATAVHLYNAKLVVGTAEMVANLWSRCLTRSLDVCRKVNLEVWLLLSVAFRLVLDALGKLVEVSPACTYTTAVILRYNAAVPMGIVCVGLF